MSDFLVLMAAPIAACAVLVGIHAWLGLQVLSRGVIFVDLALAQVAALGAAIAMVMGYELHSPAALVASLIAALVCALLLSWTNTQGETVPQEAIIGVIYVVSAAASILVLDRTPHGAELLKTVLVGQILWVDWEDVLRLVILYAIVGALHWGFRGPLLALSAPEPAKTCPGTRAWDFLFYASFGVVITASVPIAGVLLVFTFLIVPAVCAVLVTASLRSQLLLAWLVGSVMSAVGCLLSYLLDSPTGATIVCTYGAALATLGLVRLAARRH